MTFSGHDDNTINIVLGLLLLLLLLIRSDPRLVIETRRIFGARLLLIRHNFSELMSA